ncbi:hypothetical protein BKA80DRAFT_263822 [Phyllosticta citrichinensis]
MRTWNTTSLGMSMSPKPRSQSDLGQPSSGIESVLRAADFLEHPAWPRDAMQLAPSIGQVPHVAEPAQYPASMARISRQSGSMSGIDNEAMIAWNSDTYNPGFGFGLEEPPVAPLAKKQRLRRNTNGFPCSFSDCDSVFDRQCDLDRHFKTSHTSASDRPHKCNYAYCDLSFVYPKDLRRHESTHSKGSTKHPCPVDSCDLVFSSVDFTIMVCFCVIFFLFGISSSGGRRRRRWERFILCDRKSSVGISWRISALPGAKLCSIEHAFWSWLYLYSWT